MIMRDLEVWTGTPDDTSEPDDMIRVTFAVPTPKPDHEARWNGELRIDAFATTRVHVSAGIDGMQAVRLAMRFAEAELGFLPRRRGVTIMFLGSDNSSGLMLSKPIKRDARWRPMRRVRATLDLARRR